MKKFLMTAVLGMFALAGFSQVKWDARVGMNFSNMTKFENTKALPGFQLGVGMDYGFSENWSLQSGLMISSKGYKVKDYAKVRPIYLDIPILAAYKFNISDNTKFVINAGPYLAFGLGGKCKFDEGGDYKLFKGEDGEDAEYSRFDLGIQYGIGLEIGDHYLVNLTGQNGFISPFDYPDGYDGDKPKNMTFSIGVGYRF
ncbi:PorT family protein [Phocaeicola plebeius]|jgi:opacity protein-like surface antigen|uniref:PorT family protein n=1 Tax=Phocaeicola plebeius TaxID=310297 RepID=A0A414WQP9_9BACT|nr:porin family protein [Phocaeicola plebeius]RHH39231.1 PorT family protein [Phocaeicola plebeius]